MVKNKTDEIRLKPGKKYTGVINGKQTALHILCGIHKGLDGQFYWVYDYVSKDGSNGIDTLPADHTYCMKEITTEKWLLYLRTSYDG